MNLDAVIDSLLSPIADKISGLIFSYITVGGVKVEFLVALLISAALYFTFKTKFIGFWGFKHAIKLITNNYKHNSPSGYQRKKKGELSSFQALSATISASAGIGNVAGSAAAVSIGGPGVIFWMIIAGLFSMALKFSEVLLGVKFRQTNPDGSVSGGPMYYIPIAFRSFGKVGEKIGKALSKTYAVCCIFAMIGGWNLFQINAMTAQFTEVTGGENSIFANNGWILGTIVAIITWFTIIGGIKAIGKFTSKVTPIMCSLYVISAFLVCLVNIHHLPETVALIIKEAFSPKAMTGGAFACLLWGFRRAMFANESGLGTAPIAFSAVNTNKPVAQAFISMLQPFVDTVIVGVATGSIAMMDIFRVVASGADGNGGIKGKHIPGDCAIVVLEGISMYLKPEELQALFAAIRTRFSTAAILMDCYTQFAAKASKYKNPINDVGVTEVYGLDDPRSLEQSGLQFLSEWDMTPEDMISQLQGMEKWVFRKLYAGKMARKLYRMYEFTGV